MGNKKDTKWRAFIGWYKNMSKILELYKYLLDGFTDDPPKRFIDEIFKDETYKSVCPQLTIIDGGAYEGEFGFYCLPFAKVIYAFEPDPRPFKVMDETIKEFELQDVIKHSSKALAGENGKRWFHNSGYGGSTLQGKDPGRGEIEVETTTLATVIKENKIKRVDILKVDMEHSEKEVLTASDFSEVASIIKMIIGEHLEDLNSDLEKLGFTYEKSHSRNFVFRHK